MNWREDYRLPISDVPEARTLGWWINTLLVAPKFRRIGIGSRLVQEAERHVAKVGTGELYVYTNVPQLYQKLGWELVKELEQKMILRRAGYGKGRT